VPQEAGAPTRHSPRGCPRLTEGPPSLGRAYRETEILAANIGHLSLNSGPVVSSIRSENAGGFRDRLARVSMLGLTPIATAKHTT